MLKPPEHFEDRVGNTFIVIGQSAGNLIEKYFFMNQKQNLGIYLKPKEKISKLFLS